MNNIYDFNALNLNLYNYFKLNSVNDKKIENYINTNLLIRTIDAKILWEDLDKLEGDAVNTPIHIYNSYTRLLEIAYGYSCPKSKYYQDELVKELIIKSIDVLHNYFNIHTKLVGNWWYWRIGIPYQYDILCVLMKYCDSNFEQTMNIYLSYYIKHLSNLTYANLASICRNLFVAGAICNNSRFIDEALKYAIPAFKGKTICQIKLARFLQKLQIKWKWFPQHVDIVSGKEGIYSDYSFIQHTSVPYIGTYGIEIIQYAALLYQSISDTNISIPDDIIYSITFWVNAYAVATYNDEMMVMYCGRSIAECAPNGIVNRLNKYISDIYGTNSFNWKITNDFAHIQSNADKALYQHDGWRIGVSMCSDRNAKYENFSNQNNTGWYQNLGMVYLYTPGCTYEKYLANISPYYLPGVTCNNDERLIKDSMQPTFHYVKNDVKYSKAGGCVLNNQCMSAMQQVYDENYVFAKKSWFMYNDSMICIGTDIQGNNLYTTLYNNPNKSFDIKNDGSIFIENYGTITVKDTVYNIINNTVIANNDKNNSQYEYSIIPLKNVDSDYPYYNLTTYKDNAIHALYNFKDEVYMLNCFGKTNITIGQLDIQVNKMVSLIIDNKEDDKLTICINDITQSNKKQIIHINGKYISDSSYCKVRQYKRNLKIYSKLIVNTKDMLGHTVTINLIKC